MRTQERQGETRTNAPKRHGQRRIRAGTLGVGAGATLGVMALLLLLPAVSAASVASFAAPFTGGTAVQIRDPVSQGCGQKVTVAHAAAFALATGKATGQAGASASPCSTADSQASYDGIMGVKGLSFAAASSGSVTVKASWTVTWNVSASMSTAAANAGAQSTVEIYLILKVTDTTTKKTTTATTVFIVQKDLTSAARYVASGAALAYTDSLSGFGLVGGHSYTIYAALAFSAQAVVPQGSPAGSLASAAVDLGSTGHGGSLSSITVG